MHASEITIANTILAMPKREPDINNRAIKNNTNMKSRFPFLYFMVSQITKDTKKYATIFIPSAQPSTNL